MRGLIRGDCGAGLAGEVNPLGAGLQGAKVAKISDIGPQRPPEELLIDRRTEAIQNVVEDADLERPPPSLVVHERGRELSTDVLSNMPAVSKSQRQ